MLSRPTRACCALALTAALLPALSGTARADKYAWAQQLGADFRKAQTVTHGKDVTVAVLSSGVDPSVRTLAGAVTTGRDFYGHSTKPIDGTLLASFIAGSGPSYNSPFAIRGLAPAAHILSVRIRPDGDDKSANATDFWDGEGPRTAIVNGIRYAADQHARVIVLESSSWTYQQEEIGKAVDYARSKGSVIITWVYSSELPGALPGVIGVGTLNADGSRYAKYSAKNSAILVSAPGFKVPSTGPGDQLYLFWGGAPAEAWVAAAAALVISAHPKLTAGQVARALTMSARHPKGGYNTEVGFGTINPAGALDVARSLEKQTPADTAPAPAADTTHFGGRQPARIVAVQPGTGLLAGLWALVAVGLLAVAAAVLLLVRGRRRSTGPPLDQILTPQPAFWVPVPPDPATPTAEPAPDHPTGDEPSAPPAAALAEAEPSGTAAAEKADAAASTEPADAARED